MPDTPGATPTIGRAVGALAVLLTRLAHRLGTHHYLSTGCLHGDHVLPDGRTGHQYCQADTGKAGSKRPAQCKFCGAPCQCQCHTGRPGAPAVEGGDQ
ncbi:MAG: hypothetical protein HOW97_08110 [Catenulispora sp.]|nr:hypothetical protein [Catenulispora sp.]